MEAIILAGGRGTRLHGAIPASIPKPLAPIRGRPFLSLLLEQLQGQKFDRVIISVGWKAEAIIAEFGPALRGMQLEYCREDVALGTGGAVKAALSIAREQNVFVLNGDTFLALDYRKLLDSHEASGSRLTMACVMVDNAARYGGVLVRDGRLEGWVEKGLAGPGYINAGTYVMARDFLDSAPAGAFSLEADFLAPQIADLRVGAFFCAGTFIDIGVPEDLERAQRELPEAIVPP